MKTKLPSIVLALVAILALPISASAAKPGRKKAAAAADARVLARFDRNHNQRIDENEARAARRLFGALSGLDTDKNGQLSDSEISAAKIAEPAAQKKGAGKKKQAK
jgi:hypothetical protein